MQLNRYEVNRYEVTGMEELEGTTPRVACGRSGVQLARAVERAGEAMKALLQSGVSH